LTYLLDTNVLVSLMRGTYPSVRARYTQAVDAGDVLATSAVVAFELWYGVEKSARKAQTAEAVTALLNDLQVWPLDSGDAAVAGHVRAALESSGNDIGAYDLLIAGVALNRNVTLVSANVGEFARVTGLVLEDWSVPASR
jgi:tRNA(fMet)-specific endonuclease VapC